MNKVLVSGLALALCVPVAAQSSTKSFTSPDGFEKSEGAHYGYYVFRSPNGKFQSIEGEYRGTPKVFTGIQFRRDSTYSASIYSGMGRSFTSASIQMSDSDYVNAASNFATNQKSTPTTVWSSAKFSLPTNTGYPTIKNPAVWGGLKGEFNFTFSKVWLYTGKKDYAVTWDLRGAKYANGYTTTYGLNYYLDGEYINTNSSYLIRTNVPATRVNCNDSSLTAATGAYMYGSAAVHGKYSSQVNYRGKVYFSTYSYYTAPGAPVIHALGLANPKGANIGAKCNSLYINATYPMVTVGFQTPPNTTNGYSGSYIHVFPWFKFMSGLQVAVQAAWSDSKTGQLGLTQGSQFQLPKSPPPDVLPKRTAVYMSGTRTYISPTGYINPITRYLHK